MPERARTELAPKPRPHAQGARHESPNNPVLWLQREAGNAAVAGLLGSLPGTVQRDAPAAPAARKVNHASGERVDKYLLANSFLKPYIKAKMEGGTTGAASVKIQNAADFAAAWVSYAVGRDNPETGRPFTRDEAVGWEPKVNAFTDAGTIHVHEMRGDPGTTIHETLHLLSDSGFVDLVGYHFNEGVTDYFTHLVASQHKIERSYNFPRQVFVIDRMVRISSREKVADAYFKNSIDGLKAAVEAKSGAGAWDRLLGYMRTENFSEATKLVK
jgi:hypothetical protein